MLDPLSLVATAISLSREVIYLSKQITNQPVLSSKANKPNVINLFGFLKDADFSTGETPPDDEESLKLFEDWTYKYFKGNREIKYKEKMPEMNIDKHICSIGGPVDHVLTRYAMGYDKKGQEWKPILPYMFPLREAENTTLPVVRKWKGEEWTTTRNWYIADRKGKVRFIPETDTNGILKRDFLMLIISPNTFTKKAFFSGQKHFIIAATHGLAQLAVKDILDSNEILKELNEVREKSEYIQAIIEVQGIWKRNGYIPSGNYILRDKVPLGLEDFKELINYKDWF